MISFADFMAAQGRPKPHRWLERLAERCADDAPPAVIAAPTGAGKTTTVDALVWALATQADRPAAQRTIGVRIVWAIDRRILVDEVHDHAAGLAKRLARALADPADQLHDLAARLAGLAGDGAPPLVATRWRGGIEEEREHAIRGPLQPQVITSTVAQIGSRLLFRGYGVGEGSLALEAGLAACDTTICLDEAHLAEPFRQTVEAVRAARAGAETAVQLPGLRTVVVTATPDRADDDVIRLTPEERDELGARLTGPKWARLSQPEGTTGRERAVALVQSTLGHLADGAKTIACIANTVRRAREVFESLRVELDDGADVILLVGPQRPADREQLLAQHGATLFNRATPEKPLVCVATQTFEVGLDADVEAMVTESASASALVQRLGRLNRRGDRVGNATIVRDDQCWLYADDEGAAWEWLHSRANREGVVDVSVAALDADADRPASRLPAAASLTTEVVDALIQTSPHPGHWQEPDIEAFLRGQDTETSADVAVCWRADVRPDVIDDGYHEMLLKLVPPQQQELLTLSITGVRALLAARYPSGGSPSVAARLALSDVDVERSPADAHLQDASDREVRTPFVVLRRGIVVRGAFDVEDADAIRPSALAPGDIIVLPTAAGGVDDYGLSPRSGPGRWDVAGDLRSTGEPAPVRITREALLAALDRADKDRWLKTSHALERCAAKEQALTKRDKPAAEVLSALVASLRDALPHHEGLALLADDALAAADRHLVLRAVGPTDENRVPIFERDAAEEEELAEEDEATATDSLGDGVEPEEADEDDDERAQEEPQGERPIERGWVLVPVPNRRRDRDERVGDDRPPTLDTHALAVHERLAGFADSLALAEPLRASLLLAARAHDHGKADRRIQAFYRRGVKPLGIEAPLAKSEFGTSDPRTSKIAARLAELPRSLHHEIASVAAFADALGHRAVEGNGFDADLALFLVGAHHGRGRPIPELPRGGAPPCAFHVEAAGIAGAALGDGHDGWDGGAWLERFWRVIERYGAWGSSYLCALLMLADRAVSSEGR